MNATPTPQTGFNPWPVSIIGFFALALLSCGLFVFFCSRHPVDLVSADYYEQEVRYQSQFDRSQNALRGEAAAVTYDAVQKQIRIALPSHQLAEAPVGEIQLYRPSALDQDQHIPLAVDSAGQQFIDASKLLPGLWKVRISWSAGRQDYFIDQHLVIPGKAT